MKKKNRKKNLKMLVVGLDGATFRIIQPLIQKKRLPHLKKILEGGCWAYLCSTIPPVSACAWSSFMTGKNPGKHGIFHWRTYNPFKYTSQDKELINNQGLMGTAFWDFLGESDYRVGVITVPVTYPVWEINGIMLAGYPCPDKELNYTYPEDYAAHLKESYNFQVDYYLKTPDKEIIQNGLNMLEKRTTLAMKMIEKERLDVCVLVLGEIDRAQHDFWKFTDPSFKAYHGTKEDILRESINMHYEACDRQVGRLLEMCTDETTVIIMSDHGGAAHPPQYFYTNTWLRERGYLTEKKEIIKKEGLLKNMITKARRVFPFEEKLKQILPESIIDRVRSVGLELSNIDWDKTQAYRFPMYHPAEGIEINLKGRQPEGIVEPGEEFDELRALLKNDLLSAKDQISGKRIVKSAFFKEELYKGQFLDIAPDIIFLLSGEYTMSEHLRKGEYVEKVDLDSLEKYNGVHAMEGIFIAYGKNIAKDRKIDKVEITDIAPTVLYTMGVSIPKDMDGKVLLDIFNDSFRSGNEPRYSDRSVRKKFKRESFSQKEEKEMEDKLKGLGYID